MHDGDDHGPLPASRCVYDRSLLLSMYTSARRPSPAVVERVRTLGLWSVCRLRRTRCGPCISCYRGRRSGRPWRPSPCHRAVGNGAAVITGNRPVRPLQVRRPTSSLLACPCRSPRGVEWSRTCFRLHQYPVSPKQAGRSPRRSP